MANVRETGGSTNISVGGPGGIRIEGANVHVRGVPVVSSTGSSAGPMVRVDLASVPSLVLRYSGPIAALLWASGTLLVVGAAAVIAAFGLPWLLFGPPAVAALALMGAAAALLFRGRRHRLPGGVDPDIERRLLDVAVACGGRVSVTEVARDLALPLAEADRVLTALARTGHVRVDNEPSSGAVVYVFPDIEAGLVRSAGTRSGFMG